ncbi:MAG: ABC transporter ATP-binding protein [Syntrophobacteraceae bacterium]
MERHDMIAPAADELVRVENLVKHFPLAGGLVHRTRGTVRAVDDVSFAAWRGETLGVVGESGCGKSTLARLLLRLLEPDRGKILFGGIDICALDGGQFRKYRRKIQMVFQDSHGSLNPRMKLGSLIAEPLKLFGVCSKAERRQRAMELLKKVELGEEFYDKRPREVSGGQKQRIGIARAMAIRPELIVCDEPVSALDVSIQSQIINLFKDLQSEYRLTYLFISHDLSVVKYMCDRMMVVYLGKIVEMGPVEELFADPKHPYTQALLSAIPVPDPEISRRRIILNGEVPDHLDLPPGCRFHTRCPIRIAECLEVEPMLSPIGTNRSVACHRAAE